MKRVIFAMICFAGIGFAHNSYTGNYSGAPGKQFCASSCHGGTGGTLVVSGFPASYQPEQTYRIVIKHNGGSKIVNFNATTRVGATSGVAGTFTVVSNVTKYSGADGGMYASPHSIDSALFDWKAPVGGTGAVKFYASAFQGTTSSKNGQSSNLSLTSSEILTDVESTPSAPGEFSLSQNFPNPFNPTTEISFSIEKSSFATVQVFSLLGQEVATIVTGVLTAGKHTVTFNAAGLSSGVYLYRLEAKDFVQTRKMVLTK